MQLQTKLDGNLARFPRLLNLGRLAAGFVESTGSSTKR
jgi:hypothetical protein